MNTTLDLNSPMNTVGNFCRSRLPALALYAMILTGCNGCITASLATIGTVLGAVGSAASAGSEVYSLGKLDVSVMATFDECRAAVTQAATDLQLHVKEAKNKDKPPKDVSEIELEDDLKSTISVRVERRTGRMCRCRVDVGLFGSEPTAKLLMHRIRHHLPDKDSDTMLDDAAPARGIKVFRVCRINSNTFSPQMDTDLHR